MLPSYGRRRISLELLGDFVLDMKDASGWLLLGDFGSCSFVGCSQRCKIFCRFFTVAIRLCWLFTEAEYQPKLTQTESRSYPVLEGLGSVFTPTGFANI